MMKRALLLLLSASLLTSCAGSKITKTYVATGATDPKVIFIRPFTVTGPFVGLHRGGDGERPIRKSLAGREFADALQKELATLAPSAVLKPDEKPIRGWVVDGELELVDAGNPVARAFFGHIGLGRSMFVAHVRIRDIDGTADNDAKSGNTGNVIYEFDVTATSGAYGRGGTIYAPGLGYASTFDYKNAAERVMLALSRDPLREGDRVSPVLRPY